MAILNNVPKPNPDPFVLNLSWCVAFSCEGRTVCTWRRVNRNYEKARAAWNTKLQNAKFFAFGSKGVLSAFSLFQILDLLDKKKQKIIQEIIKDV